MPVTDEDAALHAISTLERLSVEQTEALNAINSVVSNNEPFADIHELFQHYNVLYFRKLLVPRVEVIWSPRLTLCAGVCELSKDPSTGKFTRIRLKMSTPLLQYRPRSDTINTLLHEAIHAYLFITTSWRHSYGDDGTGHGAGFQLLADAINNHGNYDITIFHTFHDEVDSYRTHVWQCDGPCRTRSPYFGLVKRSMNRPPGKSDTWWAKHEAECGGVYVKIQEPPPTKKQIDAMSKKERAGLQKNKLDSWVKAKVSPAGVAKSSEHPIDLDKAHGASTGGPNGKRKTSIIGSFAESSTSHKRKKESIERVEDDSQRVDQTIVNCPICSLRIGVSEINKHLDEVHPT